MDTSHGSKIPKTMWVLLGTIVAYVVVLLVVWGCAAGAGAEPSLRSPQYQACLDLRTQIRTEELERERRHPGSLSVWIPKPHCRRNMK